MTKDELTKLADEADRRSQELQGTDLGAYYQGKRDAYRALLAAAPPSPAQEEKYYSGDASEGFWYRVNVTGDMELYSLACRLQELEDKVLAALRSTPAAKAGDRQED